MDTRANAGNLKRGAGHAPERRRLRSVVAALVLGAVGLTLLVGTVLYDLGVHAAWAESAESFDSPEAVKEFVEQCPASTVGEKAFNHAVKVFAEGTRAVEELLTGAERLQRAGRFEEVEVMVRAVDRCEAPAQVKRIADLAAWAQEEAALWRRESEQFADVVAKGLVEKSFEAYKNLRGRFPHQSRALAFPACVTALPPTAVVGTERGVVGSVPARIECREDTRLRVGCANFFTEELGPPRAWKTPFPFIRLKPKPLWKVGGGGRFTVTEQWILLVGDDGVDRLVRRETGHVETRKLHPASSPGLGAAIPFGTFFVLPGNGAISLIDGSTLEVVRRIPFGAATSPVFVGEIDGRRFLAGAAESGIAILRDPICRIEHRYAGPGPIGPFLAWRGSLVYANGKDEVLLWRNNGLQKLCDRRMISFFVAETSAGGLADAGDVLLWNEMGDPLGSFSLGPDCSPASVCAIAADGGRLALGTGTGEIRLYSLPQGSFLWRRVLGTGPVVGVVLSAEHIFAATESDGIHVVRAATGEPAWHIPTEGAARTARHGETLYVSDRRALYAYRIAR